MALETLRKRLQKHYDGRAELRLSSSAQGTLVTLDLPKQTKIHGGQVKP
jgi:LytS/YehU family sensor histidine kinase